MSYYCKGQCCPRAKDCLRAKAWSEYPNKNPKIGYSTGVWLVIEFRCIRLNYEDGVFKQKQ